MIEINKSLSNKTLLITGTTGFLGKVFLHNILLKSPDIKKIYILIRGKNQQHVEVRYANEILTTIPYQNPSLNLNKVYPLKGDLNEENLGLENSELITKLKIELDYVINIAASINFFEPISDALNSNYFSVKNILQFAQHTLKAKLLHVSTCYVSGKLKGEIHETIIEPNRRLIDRFPLLANGRVDLNKLNNYLQREDLSYNFSNLSKCKLNYKKSKLGKKISNNLGWHDIYTLTKWMGEQYIDQNRGNLQCTIVRPSIITSSLKDACPGWIEGFKVIDPLIYFVGTKRISHFAGSSRGILDLIPVDVVADTMIAALAELSYKDDHSLRIYHASSGYKQSINIQQLYDFTTESFKRDKSFLPFTIPRVVYVSALYCLYLFFHILNFLLSSKRLQKKQKDLKKLNFITKIFSSYTTMQADFTNFKCQQLIHQLSHEDREILVIEEKIDWENYIKNIHIPGLMQHVVNKKNQESDINSLKF